VNEIAPGSAVLQIEFQERRSRLSFLQPLLGYPQLIVVAVVALPLLLADLVAWLALIITGRDPAFTIVGYRPGCRSRSVSGHTST
jgi:hypothetical protein